MTTNEIALDALAAEIRAQHYAVRLAVETATEHAIQCGHLLIEAKDGMAHGQWLPWIKDHCALSERTAQTYMRLARKHGELDDEKAQRVADLPVREAMKAIADERAENPVPMTPNSVEHLWEWAKKQVNGPFNKLDLDNMDLARAKLLHQTGVPTVAAFCISKMTEEIPTLRLAPFHELSDATNCLVPVAKGSCAGLDIDFHDIGTEAAAFIGMLELIAQRTVGALLRESGYRCDAYSLDGYAEQYGRDFDKVQTAFLENCKARLADLGVAA